MLDFFIEEKVKKEIIGYVYSLIDGYYDGNDPCLFKTRIEGYDRLFITFLIDGSVKACYGAVGEGLQGDIAKAVELCMGDARSGSPLQKDELEKVELVIDFLYNEAEVPRVLSELYKVVEPGIHALGIEKEGRSAFFKASVPISKNFSLAETVTRLCHKAGFSHRELAKKSVHLYRYDTLNFRGDRSGRIKDLYRYNTSPDPEEITDDLIRGRISLSRDWFLNNVDESTGLLQYMYHPSRDSYSKENNHIRQIATIWASTMVGEFLGDHGLDGLIETSLDHYLASAFQKGKGWYLGVNEPVNIANNAFLILSLLKTPDYPDREIWLERLGKGITTLQRDDGSLITSFWRYPGSRPNPFAARLRREAAKIPRAGLGRIAFNIRHPRRVFRRLRGGRNRSIDFYPGEAMLALMMLHRHSGDDEYLDGVRKAYPYYRRYWRGNKNTAFVPWHSQALSLLYEETRDESIPVFVFEMNDWLLDSHQIKDGPYHDKIGGFGHYPGSSTSSFLEGLNGAYRLAKLVGDQERMDRYSEAIRLGVGCILQMQYTDDNSFYLVNPRNAIGGFKQSIVRNDQRIDFTQHALNALIKAYENEIFHHDAR